MTLLICASDAGGARNLAPVAALAAERGEAVTVLGSTATLPLFAEAGVRAEAAALADIGEAAALLRTLAPRAVLCGTTRYEAAETRLIVAARALGLPSLAVLDEWYGYHGRFVPSGPSDRICCPDDLARDDAAAEGLPAERLVVTGSPALAALAGRIAAAAETPPPPPASWEPGRGGPRLLFVSETHAADYGTAPGQDGPLGPFLGYTEHEVRADLASALASLPPFRVVEKLHPSTEIHPAPPAGAGPGWRVTAAEPLWPLLRHADLVVGMRSMALLEAAMFGHRPLAYQPGLIGPDRCTAARLGLADTARDLAGLAGWLGRHRQDTRRQPFRPACADAEAAARVLEMCGEARTLVGQEQLAENQLSRGK